MERSPLDERRRRGRVAFTVVAVVLAGLGLGFFHAQVVRSPDHAMRPAGNSLRAITMHAPRGLILDRDGQVLAENVPMYVLSLLPGPPDSVRAALERLAPYLALSDGDVARLLARQQDSRAMLVVTDDAPRGPVSRIEERRSSFPGLVIETRPRRSYPAGPATAHLVAYVEAQYEDRLAGRAGLRQVEADRHGRVIGGPTSPVVSPVAGEAVHLSVDLSLQRRLAALMPDTARGGVAVIEPASGAVVALYSSPSYEPNDIAGWSGSEGLARLRADPAEPLRDRAMGTRYDAGRIWHVATAAIALDLGVVSGESAMPLACRGGMPYGERYLRCVDPRGHGAVNLVDALRAACDVYFYQVGLQLGLTRLAAEGARLGLARPSGLDLPGEAVSGIRVDGTPLSALEAGERAALLAAGAVATEASPLQLAHYFAALLTPGGVPDPRMGHVAEPGPAGVGFLDPGLESATRAALREGLRRGPYQGNPVPQNMPEHWEWLEAGGQGAGTIRGSHTWFVGLAGPRDGAPALVVAAVIEGSGPDPAEIAARAVDHHLRAGHVHGPDG